MNTESRLISKRKIFFHVCKLKKKRCIMFANHLHEYCWGFFVREYSFRKRLRSCLGEKCSPLWIRSFKSEKITWTNAWVFHSKNSSLALVFFVVLDDITCPYCTTFSLQVHILWRSNRYITNKQKNYLRFSILYDISFSVFVSHMWSQSSSLSATFSDRCHVLP